MLHTTVTLQARGVIPTAKVRTGPSAVEQSWIGYVVLRTHDVVTYI